MAGSSEIPARESRTGSRRLLTDLFVPGTRVPGTPGRPRGRFRAEHPVRSRISGDGGRETVKGERDGSVANLAKG